MVSLNNKKNFYSVLNIPSAIIILILAFKTCKAKTISENSGVINVLESSEYCSLLESSARCICDFSNINETVSLASQFETYALELSVTNTKRFIFHPLCSPSWITVYSSSFFTTLPDPHGNGRSCTVMMKIVNSTVDNLSHGIHEICIIDSTVQRVNLRNQRDFQLTRSHVDHLEWLDWEGYSGNMINSSISKLSHLSTIENFHIQNSKIGTISMEAVTFAKGFLAFSHSKIDFIGTNGLTLTEGALVLKNVIFGSLDQLAIVVDANTKVSMKNVTILIGKSPIFMFPSSQNVELVNVTVEGTSIMYNTDWIAKTEKTLVGEKVSKGMKECRSEGNSLDCDFQGLLQEKLIDVQELAGVTSMILRNGKMLTISNINCKLQNLIIFNSNITQISGMYNSSALCDSNLIVKSSTVMSVAVSTFKSFELKKSFVKYLEAENIQNLEFRNSTVEKIKFLLTRSNSREIFVGSKIGLIVMAHVNGPLEIVNSSIETMKTLTINHERKTSKFSNVKLGNIAYRGLRLKSGHLAMSNVSFSNLFHQSIFLEKEGTLSINNTDPIPSTGRGFVSLLKKEQINLHVPIAVVEESWYYSIRSDWKKTHFNDYHSKGEIHLNGTFLPSPYCHTITSTVMCDFRELADAAVNVNFLSFEPYAVSLGNINYLTLHPICSAKVSLRKISNGTVLESETCPLSMQIDDSSFMEISCGMLELSIRLSKINIFIPNSPVQTATIVSSAINVTDSLTCSTACKFVSSALNVIEEIIVLGRLSFHDGHINLVNSMAITVKGSKSTITQTKINTVKHKGFTVFGELHISNTTIEFAEDMSFDIYGLLHLDNVIIKNASSEVFNIRHRGSVRYEHVKINRKFLKISQNIIFLKEEEEIVEESFAFDENFATVARNGFLKSSVDYRHENSWIGASTMGFFIGVACATMTMCLLIAFRTKITLGMRSTMRWISLENEPDLVATSEEDYRELQWMHEES